MLLLHKKIGLEVPMKVLKKFVDRFLRQLYNLRGIFSILSIRYMFIMSGRRFSDFKPIKYLSHWTYLLSQMGHGQNCPLQKEIDLEVTVNSLPDYCGIDSLQTVRLRGYFMPPESSLKAPATSELNTLYEFKMVISSLYHRTQYLLVWMMVMMVMMVIVTS